MYDNVLRDSHDKLETLLIELIDDKKERGLVFKELEEVLEYADKMAFENTNFRLRRDVVENIPPGWWLNVTVMARKENPSWIVGVLREGKGSWITEAAKGDLHSSQDAYSWGMDFIERYNSEIG